MSRTGWALVAVLAAAAATLPWLIGSTVCDTNSAGVTVCKDGPALGVPGAVLATFWLSVIAIVAAIQALKKN
ncbi:hypothetical protein [Demequina sp. NBRC 110052]|uniref:hypothetical protein n=1 Tax=Demequina sp. NBRC 110052 TaxID=1570341 RepID=UPI0009FF6100|nr:hypothetical protein [Demequina sp. NBRC 110052]